MKKLIIFLVCIFLLSGCTKEHPKEEIVFSSWGSVSEVKVLKDVISDFEKENKDIDEASVILNYVYNKDFWLKALFKINLYYLKYFIFKLLNKL